MNTIRIKELFISNKWYIPDFFLKFKADNRNIVIEKSIQKNKLLNYRIDVKIIKK